MHAPRLQKDKKFFFKTKAWTLFKTDKKYPLAVLLIPPKNLKADHNKGLKE